MSLFDALSDDPEEEAADIRALDEALAEPGEPIPWEQVKLDLGWTDPPGTPAFHNQERTR